MRISITGAFTAERFLSKDSVYRGPPQTPSTVQSAGETIYEADTSTLGGRHLARSLPVSVEVTPSIKYTYV